MKPVRIIHTRLAKISVDEILYLTADFFIDIYSCMYYTKYIRQCRAYRSDWKRAATGVAVSGTISQQWGANKRFFLVL